MALNFSFATASQIIFGKNSARKVPELLESFGSKVLIVSGKNSEKAQELSENISGFAETVFFSINNEPTIINIEAGVDLAKEHNCNVVIGIGGGSVIDGAKAIAALVPNTGNLLDYLEVIGAGKPLIENPLPCIAIPTTAGTGAEVTKNAVIKSEKHKVKVSLRSNLMYPNVAIVDPVLTYSMPPRLTASTGLDALTHLLETYVSNQANSFIDNFCEEGLKRISRSLKIAYHDGKNEKAREDMAIASMLGGIALANVKLGAVHGFAGPIGGMFPIPHGEVCACLMSTVIETNIQALEEQNIDFSKFMRLAQILTGKPNANTSDLVEWIQQLVNDLQIPSLSAFGVKRETFPHLIEKAQNSSSMKGNPVKLTKDQLNLILVKSF